jgi:DNA-binding ferritin-like protein
MQELVDLSLIGKQLHWAVVGHAFLPVGGDPPQ